MFVSTWTEDQEDTLRDLWPDLSISTKAIGKRIGVTKNAVVGKAHRMDLPPRPSPIIYRPMTDANRVLLANYWGMESMSIRAIARALHSDHSTIVREAEKMHLPPRPVHRPVRRGATRAVSYVRPPPQTLPALPSVQPPAPDLRAVRPPPPVRPSLGCQYPTTDSAGRHHFECPDALFRGPYCLRHHRRTHIKERTLGYE